jgi:hypothetical protein
MIRTIVLSALASGMVLASMGCAPNATVGNGIVMAQQFFGDAGFVGHGDNITILSGSKINKLSVQGDNNTITVQDNVTIWKIEFWGKGNTVSIPEDLSVRANSIGANQIIRRPRAGTPMPRYEAAPYTPPPTEPMPRTPTQVQPSAKPAETGLPSEADVMENEPPVDEK